MVIPFRVPCYSFTREGAIARAREWFVNLVAEYEAAGRQAQLVQEYERLSGPDRVDNLTPAELLLKWSALHSHFRSLRRPGDGMASYLSLGPRLLRTQFRDTLVCTDVADLDTHVLELLSRSP